MTTPVNDRDLFLAQAATRDVDPRAAKYVLLTPTTPIFRVSSSGVGYPSTIDLTALLVNLPDTATIQFAIGSGGSLTGTGLTRTLAFSSMTTDTVSVNVSVSYLGQTYIDTKTISKVADGSSGTGTKGDTGNTVITTFLYKWSTVTPALPSGTATCTTASGKNTSYSGTDGWYVDPPANTGAPGLSLFIAQKTISVPYGVVSTAVTYSDGATVAAYSTNGATGQTGLPGIKNTLVRAYRWSNGPAPTISGTATYTWSTATYDTVPSGWTKTKTDAPALGYTLYEATVGLVDSSGSTTTSVDFGTAAVVGISYMPTNGVGTKGDTGATGKSVSIAYTLVTGNTLAGSPDTISVSGTGLPPTGSWGSTNAWTLQPSVPAAGQSVFQSNGIYDGVNTVYGLPYLSSLRVGSLSTLTANLGAITAGSIDLGSGTASWHVDTSGNQWIGSGTFGTAPFRVTNGGDVTMNSVTILDKASGNVILNAGGLKAGYEAPGTKNSDIALSVRNLAVDSNFERGVRQWTTKSAYVTQSVIGGTVGAKYLFIESTSNAGSDNDAYVNGDGPQIPVVAGKTYVISFDYATAQASSIFASSCYMYQYSGNNGAGGFGLSLPVYDTGSVRVRASQVWTCPSGVTGLTPRFGIHTTGYAWLAVYNFSVVEGNKDTGWIAAPEDSPIAIAAAATTATWSSVNGRPTDVSNLVRKGNFDDLQMGGWPLASIEAIAGNNSTAVPVTKQGVTHSRDCVESGNQFNVTPGETIFVSAWLNSEATTYPVGFGFIVYDKTGTNALAYVSTLRTIAANTAWTLVEYSYVIPAGGAICAPHIYQGGFDFPTASNFSRFANLWIGRQAKGATVGAPAGTLVGGTPAATVEANAAAGASANAQLPALNSSLADKLSKSANSTLTGTIALATQYAIQVGDATNGIFIGNTGLYGRKNGATTFAIQNDGTAIFNGTLGAGIVKAGMIDSRGLNILDANGNVVLSAGSTLASQVSNNVNLVPRIRDWPTGSRYNGAAFAYNSADTRSLNGEFVFLPGNGNGAYVGWNFGPLGIAPGETYTVSFHASAGNQAFTVDVSGTNVDSAGVEVTQIGDSDYKFTETMPSNANGDAALRVFIVSNGTGIVISNIKVEYGTRATPWTDDYISPSNAARRVMPNSINNTMIGGDLYSSNWNGGTDKYGTGWFLQRDSGTLYCNNVRARGYLAGGDFSSYAWPAAGGTGFYLGPEGLLIGSYADGRYFQLSANGNLNAPGMSLVNGQLTLTNPVIIQPKINTTFSVTVPDVYITGQSQGASVTTGVNVNIANGSGSYTYQWTLTVNGAPSSIILNSNPSASSATITATGGRTWVYGYISVTVKDNQSQLTATSSGYIQIQFGGAQQT